MTMTKFDQLRTSVTDYVYHGTSIQVEGRLKGGKYDSILWTAFSPAVAQSYIAESGTLSLLRVPSYLDECVSPEDIWTQVANMAGYHFKVCKQDSNGDILQWQWIDKTPTYGELVDYLENVLGYKSDGTYYEIKRTFTDDGLIVHPANYKKEGELYLIITPQDFKVFDMTNVDNDINNPQYNELVTFEVIKNAGYDAVLISDFTQSKRWGNVGHTSLGIFEDSLDRISYFSIPAKNFDWDSDLTFQLTPDYIRWFVEQKK